MARGEGQVSPRKAAKSFAAGRTILIAPHDELNALADRQQKALVVKRRGRLSPATLTSAVEMVRPSSVAIAAASWQVAKQRNASFPASAIPLLLGDGDVRLDLQAAFDPAYDAGPQTAAKSGCLTASDPAAWCPPWGSRPVRATE